jgi:Transposase DDE domain
MEAESDDWKQIEKLLGGAEVIDALAREHGALKRARKVRDGSQVLRLSLGYATGHSLRTTAAWSGPGTGAALCDVSLLGRLREAGDFLASVVQRLLARMAETIVVPEAWQGPPVRLVDGSLFSGPGFKGMRQRLHASFDPARQIFTAIDVTAISQGESLLHAGVEQGAIAVADRNYAKTHVLRQLDENGSFFVLRAGMRSMRLIDPISGERLGSQEVLKALGQGEAGELAVAMVEAKAIGKVAKPAMPARLIILKAGATATRREQVRIEQSRRVHKATPVQETLDLAGVVMIITNLPAESWPIPRVAALYKLRWQIELAFKTLKSLFEMRDPPAKDPRLLRTWILANLICALAASLLANSMRQAPFPSAHA